MDWMFVVLVGVGVGLWILERQIMFLERRFAATVDRFEELQAESVGPLVEDRFDPLRQDELQTAFAVADDEPLLEAVVHVLHAMEIERGDNAAESGLSAEMAKGYAMAQGALKDAQEEILRWVDEANRTKRGEAA